MMTFAPPTPASAAANAADTAGALRRLAAGDTLALGVLYENEAARVYRYALALCGNAAWAADAVQEAFLALAAKPEAFDPLRGALGAYLAGTARHVLAAQRQALRLLDPLPDEADTSTEAVDASDPETMLVRHQDSAAVWAALRALPAAFREPLVLVDLQERPYVEAAQIAGIPVNTLRTRLHRARLKLAALLGATSRSLA